MKKVFISIFLLYLIQPIDVYCECKTSFSGTFGGAGITTLFDHDYIIGKALSDQLYDCSEKTVKNSATAFGMHILLGYGHQFDNNLYLSIVHESNFSSKAKHYLADQHNYATGKFKISRKFWTPSFAVAAGYVVGNMNFGIRYGVAFNRYQYEQNITTSDNAINFSDINNNAEKEYATKVENGAVNKTLNEMSSFVGVYVEKKFGDFVGYMNVDYIFKKPKLAHATIISTKDKIDDEWFDNGPYTNRTEHKRPSWKVAVGVKYMIM